jgi:hypothetical protein
LTRGIAASNVGVYGAKLSDEGHTFLGNRRGARAGDLYQLAAGMRPRVGKLNQGASPLRRDQSVVSDIAVDLQDASRRAAISVRHDGPRARWYTCYDRYSKVFLSAIALAATVLFWL